MPSLSRENRRHRSAFTLVELLVVIGIIALLVGILLPTLSNARRAAQTTKCAAALREVGSAFQLYAMENKGYYPPMRCFEPYRLTFNSNPPVDYELSQNFWMFFLGKYVAKTKMNKTATGTLTQADVQALATAMSSVLWGCPNFNPIVSTANDYRIGFNGVMMVHTGYGMNGWPEYTATYPPASMTDIQALGDGVSPTLDVQAVSGIRPTAGNWGKLSSGRWYKQRQYTNASERVLAADARAFFVEAMAAPNSQSIVGQVDMNYLSSGVWGSGPGLGETTYDFYRHGKYPPKPGTIHKPTGGKVMFNILYADGHVKAAVTREEGIKAFRMRWPG
jgi:prepilin-type N-terminal cleavage/methylation domain-containing protein/prepilin-type processing-associated H-X9-DG protein